MAVTGSEFPSGQSKEGNSMLQDLDCPDAMNDASSPAETDLFLAPHSAPSVSR